MKRLLFILTVCAAQAVASIAVVGTPGAANGTTSANTGSVSLTANNLWVVAGAVKNNVTMTISDTASNTWYSCPVTTGGGGTYSGVAQMFWTVVASTTSSTATITESGSGDTVGIANVQYSGTATTQPRDVCGYGNDRNGQNLTTNTTQVVTDPFSTTGANDVVVALCYNGFDTTFTANSGWTLKAAHDTSGMAIRLVDDENVAPGSFTPGCTIGSAGQNWTIVAAGFLGSGSTQGVSRVSSTWCDKSETLTCTCPLGTVDSGDLLIVNGITEANSTSTIADTGSANSFTADIEAFHANSVSVKYIWHAAESVATNPDTITVTQSLPGVIDIECSMYSGMATDQPDKTCTGTTSSGVSASCSYTTTATDVLTAEMSQDGQSTPTYTPGTGFTQTVNNAFEYGATEYEIGVAAASLTPSMTSSGTGLALDFVSVAYKETWGVYAPVNGSTLTGTSVTFEWYGYSGATAYWLDVGSTQGGNNYYSSGSLSSSTYSRNVTTLPSNGSTVHATWYYLLNGTWVPNYYTYTALGGSGSKGAITSPVPSSTLTGSTVTFSWTAGSAPPTGYWLDLGSSAGGNNYYSSGNLGVVFTKTVSGLPTNGTTIYATLYSLIGGVWYGNAYTYTAFNSALATGTLTTPTPGSTFTSNNVTFDWTAGSPGPYSYWLDVGSAAGGNNYYSSGNLGGALTTTVSGLPTDGSEVFLTLYTLISGNWVGNAYTYFALNATTGLATMQTPINGSTLSGNTVTFNWSSDPNATAYWVDISNVSAGGNDLDSSGNLGLAQTETIYNLPANGSTIWVSLYSYVGGQWLNSPTSYTSGP